MTKKLPSAAVIILAIMLLLSFTGCFGNGITISFDTLGGSSVSILSVDENATSLTLQTPRRTGYDFEYWCYDSECTQEVDLTVIPETSTTFYAKWSLQNIAIIFSTKNPLDNTETTSTILLVPYGGNLALADMPALKTFDGYDGSWSKKYLENITDTETIEAKYSKRKIYVTYFVDEVEYISQTGGVEATITPPNAPTKTGYYFAGWYFDTNYSVRSTTDITVIPSKSVSLYAKFIPFSEDDVTRYYTYTTSGESVTITGLTTLGSVQTELVIPSKIDGKNVTFIGSTDDNKSAKILSLFNNNVLKRIVIPNTVVGVGNFAFYGATSLIEVIIEGNTLESLGIGAFANCKELVAIDLPNTLTTLGNYCFAGMAITNTSNNNIIFAGEKEWSNIDNWIKTNMAFASLNIKEGSSLTTINNYAFFNLPNFTTAVYSSDGKTLLYYPLNGEATFTLNEDTETIASYAFYNNNKITSVTANNRLITVGQYSFYNCSNLINFDLSGNTALTTVGSYAFSLSKIATFIPPESFTTLGQAAFKEANSLTTLTFNGNNINIIPQEAFYSCTALIGVNFPLSVETIGKHAFYNCTSLSSLIFDENSILNKIDDYAFTNCTNISAMSFPSSLRIINQYAFAGISGKMNLDLTTIPSEITSLGDYAFSNTKITNFNINNNLLSLGIGVFKNCTSLSRVTVTVSNYITEIPDEMFYGCTTINQMTLPYTITSIGNYSFFGCTKLTDLTFSTSGSNGLHSIGNSSFEGCTLLKNGEASNKRIMPTTVTSVGTRAFYDCAAISKVNIPIGLLSLSSETFAYCSSLTEITYDIGVALTTIGENAFAYCTSLISARLPATLSARDNADTEGCIKNPFVGCTKLVMFVLDNNPSFSVVDGVVYRQMANGKQIYLYPTGKISSFLVSADITSIDRYAFYGTAVSSLNFNHNAPIGNKETISMVKIGAYAFSYSKINSATISKRVYLIEQSAFLHSSLATIDIESTVVVDSEESGYLITNKLDAINNNLTVENYSFKNTAITNLSIPERLVNIKHGAFSECYLLKTLTFANATAPLEIGDYAFFGDNNLTNLVLPQQLSIIGNYAFSNCFNIQTIAFSYLEGTSESLIIGDYAFSNNHYLYAAVLPVHLKEMGEGVFSYNSRLAIINFAPFIIESSLAIPSLAFFGANSLKTIILPSYISEIGEYAFGKTNLTSVQLNNGVDLAIGSYAFSEISTLKTIHFTQNVTTIGEHAFYKTGLASFTYDVSNNKIAILDYAFCQTNLINIILNERFSAIGSHAFADTKYLKSVQILGGITTIGASAFENSKLTNITLDAFIRTIGDAAFKYTTNLLEISGCFESIGDYAFAYSSISSYTCGDTLDSITIGKGSFSNCNNLLALNLETTGSINIGDFAFAQSNKLATLNIKGEFGVIGIGIAYNSTALEAMAFDDLLNNYQCVDGVLYHSLSNDATLVQYPAGKTDANCTLPEYINAIGDYAFFGNSHLLSILHNSDNAITKGEHSFTSTNNNLKIYVPENQVADYKEQWGISNISYIVTQLDGLVLKYLGNDNYSIIDYTGSETNIVISGSKTVIIAGITTIYRIVQIEEYAFANNKLITSLNIGNGIKAIYHSAFANCMNLESVTIGNNVVTIKDSAFANCNKLATAVFGSNIDNIGSYAFANCFLLNNVTLPSSLITIGDYAFSHATTLSNISLGDKLQTIGNNAFEYNSNLISITLPSSLKTINDNIFYNCEKLTFVYVLSIQAPMLKSGNAFRNTSESILFFVNENSKDIYKSDSLWRNYSSKIMSSNDICTTQNFKNYVIQNIGGNNYRLLSYLGTEENVTIVSNISPQIQIIEIGSYAISHFTKSITLNEGIIVLNDYSFVNATNLTSVTLPTSLVTIGKNSFANLAFLSTFAINDFVNSKLQVISDYAFYNTASIASINLPKNLVSIGHYAFAKTIDNLLTSIIFNTLTSKSISIGSYAFSNNYLIKEIIFNCAVSSLGNGAFINCSSLEALYFNSTGSIVATIAPNDTKVFENCNKLSVFVTNEIVLGMFRNTWTNTYDKNKLCNKTLIAHDTEELIGQDGFVISVLTSGTNTASIINYLGTDTIVTFPSSVTVNNIVYTILRIGREESSSTVINGYVISSSVAKVIIPLTVTAIGTDAFRNAKSLHTVEFSVDSSLTTIGKHAFSGCSLLRIINIPKTITSIGEYAFADCKALDNITFANLPIGSPASLELKEYAFTNCTALLTLTLPLHTYTIGEYCFSGAKSLKNIIIDANCKITTLKSYAFKDTAIESIYLPSTLSNVANYCFNNCAQLRSIYLTREIGGENSSLTTAGNLVFDSNSSPFIKIYVPLSSHQSYSNANGWKEKTVIPNLTSGDYNYIVNGINTVTLTNYLGTSTILQIPSSLEINNVAHRITAINKFAGNDKITAVVFDVNNYVTVLHPQAFASCTSLEKIHLPNAITTIGDYAFSKCTALKDIVLPQMLTKVQKYTFANCTSLTEIRVPASVLALEDSAFMSCTSLSRLIIDFIDPTALGSNALQQTPASLKIVVNDNYISLFSTEWAAYRTRLVGKSTMLGDYIVAANGSGYTLVQYNGKTDIDLTEITFFGSKINAIKEDSIIDKNIKITISSNVAYYEDLADQIIIR